MTDAPDEGYEHVVTFPGYLTKWTGETTTNNLVLSLAVEGVDAKRAALPLTDIPGTVLRITVERRTYETPAEEP